MKNLFVLLCLLLFLSCDDEFTLANDCLEEKLENLDMVEYTGQEIGCSFYVELFVLNDTQYYHLDSHCADVGANMQDCFGNDLCVEIDSELCTAIYENAERKGIVGIGE